MMPTQVKTQPGTLKLPKLWPGYEWVIQAGSERTTINLAYAEPRHEINPDVDDEYDQDKPTEGQKSGYIYSHTVKHGVVVRQEDWEADVVEAARAILTRYHEANLHAKWADEITRRSI